MTIENTGEVDTKARKFLAQARECLRAKNLRQAAESGWKAADHMARAVALAQGWLYDTPGKFLEVMGNAAAQTGDNRIHVLTGSAHILRDNSESGSELDYETIKEHVDRVVDLLDLLVPLTLNKSAP